MALKRSGFFFPVVPRVQARSRDEWAAQTVPVPLITGHEFPAKSVKQDGKFYLDPGTRRIDVNTRDAFAQYLRLPAFTVVPLPDDIPDEIGAILDPLGNAVHTALSFNLLGEDVLITGAGPIGIMAAAVAQHAGARNIVITDIDADRLMLAEHVLPSVHTVNCDVRRPRRRNRRAGPERGFRYWS